MTGHCGKDCLGRAVWIGLFAVNSPSFGFTPLVNHSWPIKNSFFKTYFVEAVLPVRFNRPTGGVYTTPVTFGLHFGLGF